MPIIALASSKGGSGKSTTALILASAIERDGGKVHIIDADPRARIAKWQSPDLNWDPISVSTANIKDLRDQALEANRNNDFVIIDLEGSASAELAIAATHADFIIIPANPSQPDFEDAQHTMSILQHVNKPNNMMGIVWSKMPPAIISREVRAILADARKLPIESLFQVTDRTAYKSMFSFGTTLNHLDPSEVPGLDKAHKEARELAEAVIGAIKRSREGEGI